MFYVLSDGLNSHHASYNMNIINEIVLLCSCFWPNSLTILYLNLLTTVVEKPTIHYIT